VLAFNISGAAIHDHVFLTANHLSPAEFDQMERVWIP
jgi:hypothetical protein